MHSMDAFDWTTDRVTELKTMVEEKHPTSYMMARFGVTRSTILGKLHRLGIKRGHTRDQAGSEGGHLNRLRRARKEKGQPKPPKSRVSLPPMPRPKLEDIVCSPVPLLELPFSGACKFEVSGSDKPSEYRFCANATHKDCVYCADHMAIAHNRSRGGRFNDDQPDGRTYHLRKLASSKVAGNAPIDLRELE